MDSPRPRTPRRGRRSSASCARGLMPPTGAPRPPRAELDARSPFASRRCDRSRRHGEAEPGRHAAASHESRGVRQRDSRSAGRSRSMLADAAARGRLGRRLRQHRRRARHLAGADRALHRRRVEDQPAGRRRHRHGPALDHLQGARRPRRRTSTSKGCRSARAAASSSATTFRWTASICSSSRCSR